MANIQAMTCPVIRDRESLGEFADARLDRAPDRSAGDGQAGDRICPGAKILAIVDALKAVTLKYSTRVHNRTVLRAIAEANACDNQFAPDWIAPFNAVIHRMIGR